MNEIGGVLLTGLGLVLFWLLTYYGWRPYRIDSVRMELFKLRNELFLFAAEGGISFDDPAYRTMRDRLNAVIRHAHIISLTRTLIYVVAERFSPNSYALELNRMWLQARSKLTASAESKIKAINDRMAFVLAWQMITGAPLLFLPVAISVSIQMLARFLRQGARESVRLKLAKELHVELIEEQAMLAQTQERSIETCEPALV